MAIYKYFTRKYGFVLPTVHTCGDLSLSKQDVNKGRCWPSQYHFFHPTILLNITKQSEKNKNNLTKEVVKMS